MQATRIAPIQQGGGLIKEQIHSAKHLVGDRIKETIQGVGHIDDLKSDHGAIVKTKNGEVGRETCGLPMNSNVIL